MITIELEHRTIEWFDYIIGAMGYRIDYYNSNDNEQAFLEKFDNLQQQLQNCMKTNELSLEAQTVKFITEVIGDGLKYLPRYKASPQDMHFLANLRMILLTEIEIHKWERGLKSLQELKEPTEKEEELIEHYLWAIERLKETTRQYC